MLDRYVRTLERAGIDQCVLLAVVSTAAWYILFDATGGDGATPLPQAWGDLPDWLAMWATGSIYAALVLYRYVPSTSRGARAAMFGLAGAVSYWIGVNFTIHASPFDSAVATTAVAGVVTAAGLGCLVVTLGTLRFSPVSFAALCTAGGLGGAAVGVEWLNELTDEFVVGHLAWQVLTCIALYYAPKPGK
ncbi:MAG: hypothetical protein OXQ90_00765 [Gammaproteobacteria bacterium]|nr:hypothetical protein [Gammaproteobacteria bacterium]